MNPRYNVALTVLSHLDNNLDRVYFEFAGYPSITGRKLKNLIINFAMNMKAIGVNQSSCLALETADIVVATAFNIAAALNGASWARLTKEVLDSEHLNITHIIHQGILDYKNDKIVIRQLDKNWATTPKGVDASFPGYKSLDSTWMITQSSGTTGNAKLMEISYEKYWNRVYNNNHRILEDVGKIAFLYTPLKSTVQYRAITHILYNIPIVVGLQYEDIPKHPKLIIAGSHQQSMALVRGRTPPDVPFDIICELGGSATSKKQIESLFPFFKTVSSGYGSTETARTSLIKWTSADQYVPCCVGVPYNDVTVKIEDGLILLKTNRNIAGYLGGEQFDWFISGDMGHINEEGELFVTGRLNERLNIGGIKIDPSTVDNYIKTLGGVVDCLTFQNTDLDLHEQLSTIVVTKLDFDSTTIFDQCIQALGVAKTPKNLYHTTIPTNETGKPSRKDAMKAVEGITPIKYSA
jgi:acyl-CoA synthetase (AMP-forming)/AMP-acid ligase II